MSAVAVRQDQQLDIPTGTEPATAQLVQWAHAAHAAHSLAEGLCNTQFVPAAYRGKPAEAAAAILAGAEVGLSPLASLRAFHNIQGTPTLSAQALRGIVQGLGHDIRIVESNDKHAVVTGRRKGEDEWQTSTWTIERAQQAGYPAKNANWRTNPAAMLVARASTEVSRWIASDAIMGMPYTVEEIRDEGNTYEARPAPRIVSAADFIEQPAEAPAEPDVEPFTAYHAYDEIAAADTQVRLDEIKAACQQAGIRDRDVLDAWAARSAQLAEQG
ncbi:hypothetical protein OHA01_26245 [Micromonospora zamorensis]|uniref:hypothetical protein n=1 Tax=Micromonospora zamorensis TaxID=709883 RepID=UPI003865E491|nr:hypothetical protein OHA01_26245 [Micromonospora zamorensis]